MSLLENLLGGGFHNGFVDKRQFNPSGEGIRYLGGGAFDIPGYEMFGDLIPLDTPSKSINKIPIEVYREQRARHYGSPPTAQSDLNPGQKMFGMGREAEPTATGKQGLASMLSGLGKGHDTSEANLRMPQQKEFDVQSFLASLFGG